MILKKLPNDLIDKESVFVHLIRTRTIIDSYQEICRSAHNESNNTRSQLALHLAAKERELRAAEKRLEQELLHTDPVDRKPSIKEIYDEVEMLMAEHKEELIVQDPQIFKEVVSNEDMAELARAYEEATKLSVSAQIAKVLNNLIEGYYHKKFQVNADSKLISETMASHRQPLRRTIQVIAALEGDDERKKRNVRMNLELLQLGEEEDFVSSIKTLFP